MKKGFYEDILTGAKEKITNAFDMYGFMAFTPVGDKCVDLYKYLSELDDEFAVYLADEFGYEVSVLVKYDEELGRDVLVHAYNIVNNNNKTLYVDARGITSDKNDVLDLFENEKNNYFRHYKFKNIEIAKEKLKSITEADYSLKRGELTYIIDKMKENYII